MNYIGEKIKELRRKNDMTQEKLADCLGVTYQTVSKWETGITSPDLSLIVPLARLFGVTTDELFDFNESAENIKRAELQKQHDDTYKSGDLDLRIAVAREAVKAYPGDMEWLNRYAWDLWCSAVSILDEAEFAAQRETVIGLFRQVIDNCKNDEVRANAIVGIVGCLNGKGEHDKAKEYAELYPDTKLSADEKERLLIACTTGEEQVTRRQKRLLQNLERLLDSNLRPLYENSADARAVGKAIIDLFIPDGNYLTFHHHLYMLALAQVRAEIGAGEYDNAMSAIMQAKEHAIAFDRIKGEYAFTSPFFDHVKGNTEEWYQTGDGTMLEGLIALMDFPCYAPLKDHERFADLLK